jgi:hypothetical protein
LQAGDRCRHQRRAGAVYVIAWLVRGALFGGQFLRQGGRRKSAGEREDKEAWFGREPALHLIAGRQFATMKIATFNINNINRRLPNLLRWLRAAKPDIVALQELKSADEDFPVSALDKAGYGAVWRGQRTWNGVAILARNADPVLIRTELPGDRDDHEARYIEAAVRGIIVTSIYLPNGNPQPGPKFDYKLEWFRRLKSHAAKFLK